MSTASKLWFGFGFLLLFLIGIGLFVSYRLASIERALATIMAVQEPATATAYEMALNVSGASAAVLAHVATGEPAHHLGVAAHHAAFEHLLAGYVRIARAPASRDLGLQIRATQARFHALGDSLMTLSDLEREAAASFARHEENLRALLARDLGARLDGRGRDGQRKLALAARLASDVNGIGSQVGLYLRTRSPDARPRIAGLAVDFQAGITQLRELRLDERERPGLEKARLAFPAFVESARAAMERADQVQQVRPRFVQLSSRLERLVDDGIHSLARTDLIEAQAMARRGIHVSIIAVLVLLVAGVVIGGSTALPVGHSIVRAEQALRDRMQELAIAHARKDEFLGILGHELRNPLAPLSNSLHVLEAGADRVPDDVRRTHAMMKRQVENMTRLVDDLLDVSRISQGKITLRRRRVNLAEILAATAEDLRPVAAAGGVQLIVSRIGGPLWVSADPTRVAQIVANLVHNAIKFTPAGGKIGLTLQQEGGEAIVRVSDTGMGIPASMLGQIFEPFTQVDPSLTRSRGGLGIGLTLVQRLAGLHGGSVRVESPGEGKGSTFTLRLPREETPPPGLDVDSNSAASAAAAETATGSMAASSAAGSEGHPPAPAESSRRILVVEDNRDSAGSMADLLRLWGHEVQLAHDGLDALEQAREFRPEVVLLDIGLPGMNGYQIAERLSHERGADGPMLIALTGLGQEEDRQRALAAGFDHHLTKPVSPAGLRELIRRGRA